MPAEHPPLPPPKTLTGWGRVLQEGREVRSEDIQSASAHAEISRGLGRSYGDSSLPAHEGGVALNTVLADRVLSFDRETGVLRAEAGLSAEEIIRLFLPAGFFLPVSPGTQFVTLGGMVAADVHGKNHHVEGTFGRHVRALRMRVADGSLVTCSRTQHDDLFRATLGGMGLTGHILEVELQMVRVPSPWIVGEHRRIENIEAFHDALHNAASNWPFTMGWIDCVSRDDRLGRGILMCGRWAEADEAPKSFPRQLPRPTLAFDVPARALNRVTVKAFNALYYWKPLPRKTPAILNPFSFFYPLDIVQNWNRMYGKRGFTQYQCVLPLEGCRDSAREVLDVLTKDGHGSFLAVIKDCGNEGIGLLSFPRPGISIALDLPIRDNTQALVDRLNEVVICAGGRIYLAKDAFTRPEHLRAMEPRLPAFLEVRKRWDPNAKFRSAQSVRLFGDRV